jgi:hypothetical protein
MENNAENFNIAPELLIPGPGIVENASSLPAKPVDLPMKKNPVGAPITITHEIEDKVLHLVDTTHDSIKTICKKCRISQEVWYTHLLKSKELREKYASAKENQMQNKIEDIDAQAVAIQQKFKHEDPRKTQARIQLFKICSDNQKWLAERMLPKKYGTHTISDVNLGGQGAANPISIEITPILRPGSEPKSLE